MTKNKLLILTATHGDEDFSIPIVQKIQKKFIFDWQISNPKALGKGVRFTDKDLNRSGPGNYKSKYYEERRAKKLITLAKKYEIVIDVHGTVSNTGCFIILSDPNWKNIELAKKLNVENVVLWPSLMPTGPLTQFIPNSLEIECGPKNDKRTAQKFEQILENYLKGGPKKLKQKFYIVIGKFTKNTKKPMKDFIKFTYRGSSFYPLLVGQYPDVKCYMMQMLNDTL